MTKLNKIRVLKRDGKTVVDFDGARIERAIKKSFMAVFQKKNGHKAISEEDLASIKEMLAEILQEIEVLDLKVIYVSQIEKIAENKMMERDFYDEAREYITYKARRAMEREAGDQIIKSIDELERRVGRVAHENANKDSNSFATVRDLVAGFCAKALAIFTMLPEAIRNAHLAGGIHFHDLDYNPYMPMTNCCLIDFEGMFRDGFTIGNAEVESPKSIQTATAQAAQIIANVTSSQYGGCSFDRADEVLAEYAKLNYAKHLADAEKYKVPDPEVFAWDKTKKDIYDAMQSFEYEVNTLYNSNGQTPFVTLGFGLGEDRFAREIQKAILRVRIKGLGKEKRTAIFPKLVFTLKRGLNLEAGSPNYDIKQLALECATKRMYPDILSYDKIVELTGSFKAPMGCRSFLQGWKDENGKEVNAGRMNLGVVTLNLPRIAMESGGSFDKFWEIFNDRMNVVEDALVFRVNRCKEASPKNAPILYQYGVFGKRLAPDGDVNTLFENRRATVSMGYIGLYEVATVFYGPEWEQNPEAKEFTLEIVRAMKDRAGEMSDHYGYHFSVYSTPSESLTDRFCRLDTEKFGIVENITDKGYYTNSFHYDVRKNPTPFEKLDFEKDYPKYCSGGFIHYCEYPVLQQNPKALEAVWDYAYDRVGYLGTNTPIDHCLKCDFKGDFEPTERGFKCPGCGNTDPKTCDVVKRTCGYLGNPQARPMVKGRHKEISARVKHMNGSAL